MLLSRCCRQEIFVQHAFGGISYYVCHHCGVACDAIESKNVGKESHNDARNDDQIA